MSAAVWTLDAMVAAAQDWNARHGHPPTADAWRIGGNGRPATSTVQLRFGSWNAMLDAAGLDARGPGQPRLWTRDIVLDRMREWAAEHGAGPKMRDWLPGSGITHPHPQRVLEMFGGWNAALDAAGVPRPGRQARWTRDLVAAAMLDWLMLTGRWPRTREWNVPAGRGNCRPHPSAWTVATLFGSWSAAKTYAGWCPQSGNATRQGSTGPRTAGRPGERERSIA